MKTARSLVRFGVTGVLATVCHVATFAVLVELAGLWPVGASVPAFLVAFGVSYTLNRRWTFRARGEHRVMLPRFLIVALCGLGLNVLITHVVVDLAGFWYGYALALVVTLVPALTYLLSRTWVFRH